MRKATKNLWQIVEEVKGIEDQNQLKPEQYEKNMSNLNKKKFKERINFAENYNLAVFKIFSDYFNIIFQDKKKQRVDGIEMIGLVSGKFVDNIELYSSLGTREVWFKFLGLTIKMGFSVYKHNGEVFYEIFLTSSETTDYKSNFIYKELFQRALRESELAGSYITMPPGAFQWEIKHLEKRSMNDIYLPQKQMEDLNLFVDVYANNSEILRYLLVGVPGTGKTEACLTLMNELKKKKVTIIKTPICNFLSEKVNLAVLLKPSIIIFDDLDLSLGSRNSGGYSNMLQSFLDILDGTDKLPKDVGILATTNSAFLLDLAAQRPGRFDKVMIFDELTKENVAKIILKSLKFNFNLMEKKDVEIFINPKIVDKFFSNKVTGAHIYNSISMMKLKHDMIVKSGKKSFKITVGWLLDEIDAEIKILDKIKAQQKINDRLGNSTGTKKIGFGSNFDEDGDEEDMSYYEEPSDLDCDINCDESAPICPK
jgi:predicted AAA+ superfamily ATPase